VLQAWRVATFLGGLFSIWIAVGSPLARLDHELLTIHMVKHLLLMAVGAPLVLLGAPALPLMGGLPQRIGRALGSIVRFPVVRKLGRFLFNPAFCWLAATVAMIGWHLPAAFELGVRSHGWHEIESACFLSAGLLFWWPVVRPWSGLARHSRWSIPLYLFLATLPCDTLSAFLAFCDRVVYPSYLVSPRQFSISPLGDQELAGALMWVSVTFIYLVPAVMVTVEILSPPKNDPREHARFGQNTIAGQSPHASEAEVV
jgi:cytochrome c oxidase assembly factor CtaG